MAQNNTTPVVKESAKDKADRLTMKALDEMRAAVATAMQDEKFYGAVVTKIQLVGGVPEVVAVTNERTFK